MRNKLESNDIKGILEAVKSCDLSLIPLLELYANQKSWYYADIALVKMGKTEYLKQIIEQTQPSKDLNVRYAAIKKLALTEHKLAYKRLYELLDNSKIPQSDSDDEAFAPISSIVMKELSESLNNPPTKKEMLRGAESRLFWKKWFDEHKELTDGAETPKCDVVTPMAQPVSNNTINSFVKTVLLTDYLSIVLLNKSF